MKRIVKETLENGRVQYKVEEKWNRDYPPYNGEWYTYLIYNAEYDQSFESIFSSLTEAEIEAGIDPTNNVVKHEILVYN